MHPRKKPGGPRPLQGKPQWGDSVGGAAVDGLKEGCGLQNVNRLRYLRLDELPFDRRLGSLFFGSLVIRQRRCLWILILICQ